MQSHREIIWQTHRQTYRQTHGQTYRRTHGQNGWSYILELHRSAGLWTSMAGMWIQLFYEEWTTPHIISLLHITVTLHPIYSITSYIFQNTPDCISASADRQPCQCPSLRPPMIHTTPDRIDNDKQPPVVECHYLPCTSLEKKVFQFDTCSLCHSVRYMWTWQVRYPPWFIDTIPLSLPIYLPCDILRSCPFILLIFAGIAVVIASSWTGQCIGCIASS